MLVTLFLSALVAIYGTNGQFPEPTNQPLTQGYLSGVWQNQHGSVMILNHTDDGTLIGEYRTKVESTPGVLRSGPQLIQGRVGKGRPTTFGFIVTFKDGVSTSAWSGQYHLCDGKEMLMTTWVLTSATGTCKQAWTSTRIGQDNFTRVGVTELINKKKFYKKRGHLKRRKKVNRKLRQKAKMMWKVKQAASKKIPKGGKQQRKLHKANKRNNA